VNTATESRERRVPAWRRRTTGEARWPMSVAVLVAVALQLVLPERLTLGPTWLLPALELALFAALTFANPVRFEKDSALVRFTALTNVLLVAAANYGSIALLVTRLLHGTKAGGDVLLASAVAIFLTNVIVFGLLYWELDAGGPVARAEYRSPHPEMLFPQMTATELVHPDWEPRFPDYLYVSLTNCTAFSPTDTMPLTYRMKFAMAVQSLGSLITVAIVAARAVNILS
jgi:hypothetical protein